MIRETPYTRRMIGMREVFTRETAVEKSLRKDARLDRGYMKRPALALYTKRAKGGTGGNGAATKYEKNLKKINRGPYLKQYHVKTHDDAYRNCFEGDKARQSYIDNLARGHESLSLVTSGENFKKKPFVVYVEKQHGDTYTLRDLKYNSVEVCDIEMSEYHDLAGRVVIMEMSKKGGKLEVHRITKMFDEKL
jgi:hypothetical protein